MNLSVFLLPNISCCPFYTFLIIALFFFNKYATVFSPSIHPVLAESDPPNAEVYINDIKAGTTPVRINLKPKQSYTVTFKKDGYEDITHKINTKVDGGWVVLDIATGLVPMVVDVYTGEWKIFDQESINASLEDQNVNTKSTKGSRIPSIIGISILISIPMFVL